MLSFSFLEEEGVAVAVAVADLVGAVGAVDILAGELFKKSSLILCKIV